MIFSRIMRKESQKLIISFNDFKLSNIFLSISIRDVNSFSVISQYTIATEVNIRLQRSALSEL
jgi:hypothetical protein